MPYIPDHAREDVHEHGPSNAGELTYAFYKISVEFWNANPRFLTGCIIVGALVCTVLELYRRKLAPYEDQKIKENGDVN